MVKNNSHPCHFFGMKESQFPTADQVGTILRVPNQNGVSVLYIMLEIHHSDQEPSISSCPAMFCTCLCLLLLMKFVFSYDRNPGYRLLEVQLVLC